MKERKFKVGDRVRTLKGKNESGISRLTLGTVGTVVGIDDDEPQYQVGYGDYYHYYYEDELELVQSAEVGPVPTHNKICSDVARDVTVEEVEKLKEKLRRKDSELHKMKELIIKLLFDRYGY